MYPFLAFLDLETTGFSPRKGDKILEVAIITTDLEGNILDRYETLINPLREVAGTQIHQITSEMVKNAPLLSDVMDDILSQLVGKVLVGHNISFDLRFLSWEISKFFQKEIEIEGVCTLKISKEVLPGLPYRRLDDFCDFFDIHNKNAHAAINDCEATVEVYKCLRHLAHEEGTFDLDDIVNIPFQLEGIFQPKGISMVRQKALEASFNEINIMRTIIQRLPSNPSTEVPVQEYLNLLDKVLADRVITSSEANIVLNLINESGLSRKQVIEIHHDYLKNLIHVYYLDHILSLNEKEDLLKVCKLLGIEEEMMAKFIQEEINNLDLNKEQISISSESNSLFGKSICFTGQLNATIKGESIPRSYAQHLVIERGMIIKSGVSAKLEYLVTADPNSLSGKSQKARNLGVIILAEPVFWNMVGVAVD